MNPEPSPTNLGDRTIAGADATRLPAECVVGAPTDILGSAPLPTTSDGISLTHRDLSSAAGPLAPGQTFGTRYHIIRLLGIGGMGAVYQAWDHELGVAVALKVIRPEATADPSAAHEMARRFKQELLLARQVTHKNVVRIHDLGEIGGIKYITMSYIEGADLASILQERGRLDARTALALARDIAAGLQAAHEAGIVHRDLKPANVMVESDHAVIMDFGIARASNRPGAVAARESAESSNGAAYPAQGPSPILTTLGTVVGTIEYMPPEQARGEPVDQRADVYAFGLILRDMLLGRRAGSGREESWRELQARMTAPLASMRTTDVTIPEPLDRVVSRCIEPDPAARYQTTTDLIIDLDRLDENGTLRPVPRRFGVRHLAASLLLTLVLVAGTWYLARTPASAPEHEPVSVLVADFDNRTGDAAFSGTIEHALGMAVEGASFVTAYPRETAQRLASTISAGRRLDEAAARLVSVREGIKVVLTGSVAAVDRGRYDVTVKAQDPTNGKVLAAETRRAGSRDDVLKKVVELAIPLRTALGDTTPESARAAAVETFTAGSLEAARDFSLGQDLASSGKDEEALTFYRRAVQRDPRFGRAYASWAVSAFKLGRREESADAYKHALSLLDRMTDREKYRTLGGYYLLVARNYEKAVENYAALVQLYPADRAGHSNLALAYFYLLNFPKALAEGRRAVAIYPKNETFRSNYALYAMYAGDFETAAAQARQIVAQNPSFAKAYLVLAIAALARRDHAAALDAYRRMAATGSFGASLAATGEADVALWEGRAADARRILTAQIVADRAANNLTQVAAKHLALGDAYVADGDRTHAVTAAQQALKTTRDPITVTAAARLLVRAGRPADARALAATLSRDLQPVPRAYGKIVEGEIALEDGRPGDAVAVLRDAQKLADLWLARFDLGQAYVQAGHYAEAIAELELAQKRQGEATAVFFDDVPSFRYLAPLPYWLARAQQGLGMGAPAAGNYQAFLSLRAGAAADPLTRDARRRLAGF